MTLLVPPEVDQLLRYPIGRSERLAKQNKIRHIRLPDGSIRFKKETIDRILQGADQVEREVAHA